MLGKMALQCGHAKSGVSDGQSLLLAVKGEINKAAARELRKTDRMADVGCPCRKVIEQ